MKYLDKKVTLQGHNDSIVIDLYGDTHFGSKSVDETMLRRHIKQTKKQGTFWAHLGDGIDGILPPDRRWNAENVSDWAFEELKRKQVIKKEWDYWGNVFQPIADKCLFVLRGDGKHDITCDVADCMGDIVTKLGIVDENGNPKIYRMVHLTLHISRQGGTIVKVPLLFHHGIWTSRYTGAKVNGLERIMGDWPEIWGFFCAHGHTKTVAPPIVSIIEQSGKGKSIYRRSAMTGGYLRTYAEDTVGYGEERLYKPAALGRISVSIKPFSVEDQERIELLHT